MIVLYIRDHGGLSKNITQKPDLQYHPDALVVLVSSKLKSTFSTTLNASNRLLQNLLFNGIFYCLPATAHIMDLPISSFVSQFFNSRCQFAVSSTITSLVWLQPSIAFRVRGGRCQTMQRAAPAPTLCEGMLPDYSFPKLNGNWSMFSVETGLIEEVFLLFFILLCNGLDIAENKA